MPPELDASATRVRLLVSLLGAQVPGASWRVIGDERRVCPAASQAAGAGQWVYEQRAADLSDPLATASTIAATLTSDGWSASPAIGPDPWSQRLQDPDGIIVTVEGASNPPHLALAAASGCTHALASAGGPIH